MNKYNKGFQAKIGHLLDLYRIATFNFSNPHSYTKYRQIKALKYKTSSKMLIETGTFRGVTTKRCASIFDKLYTIELDEKLANEASKNLSKRKNIKVLQGDATIELSNILQNEEVNNILVFLDGHFSGGITACGKIPEPAIEELKVLSRYKEKINCIIIDDFRCFGNNGFTEKSSIIKALEDEFSDFELNIHLDQIIAYTTN